MRENERTKANDERRLSSRGYLIISSTRPVVISDGNDLDLNELSLMRLDIDSGALARTRTVRGPQRFLV